MAALAMLLGAASASAVPSSVDAGVDSQCRAALGDAAAVVLCGSVRARGAASLHAPGMRRQSAPRWSRLRGAGPLRPGARLTLDGAPRPRAHLMALYRVEGQIFYVRFTRFGAGRRAHVVVQSRVKAGRLRVWMTIGHRRLAPRVTKVVTAPAPAAPQTPPAARSAAAAPSDPETAPPDWHCAFPAPAPAAGDDALNAIFNRCDAGWTGADGAYSVPLPDGRVVWIFDDTFLGHVNADGSRTANSPFLRNSFMVQDGDTMTTLTGGSAAAPDTLIPSGDPASWYWLGDGTVEGDRLRVFAWEYHSTGSGSWDFQFVRVAVATFTLPDLRLESITPPVSGAVEWGSAVLEQPGYTYVYGTEDLGAHKYVHLARAPRGGILGPWDYYTGSGWSSDPAASARLLDGVSVQYGVVPTTGGYALITQDSYFSGPISAYSAQHPEGPWAGPVTLYTTGESASNLYTYNAVPHPEISRPGDLVISYDLNSFAVDDVYRDARLYRPRFVRVPLASIPGN